MRVAPAQGNTSNGVFHFQSISIPLLTLLDTYHYVLYRLTCSVTNTHLLIKVRSVTKRVISSLQCAKWVAPAQANTSNGV